MAVALQSQDLVDPLHDYSTTVSLLNRTFRELKSSGGVSIPNHNDFNSILQDLAVKSSSNLSEQAKAVLNRNNSAELSHPGMRDRDIPPRNKDCVPQERRPGLGRKRARFSFKPNANTSQSSVGGEGMNLNLDELKDPEEFFAAFETQEKAEKELKKLRGETYSDTTQHKPSIEARRRRPGILGLDRKKVGYKHQYSSVVTDFDVSSVHSQESYVDIHSQSYSVVNLETTDMHGASQEKEAVVDGCIDAIQDSIAEEKNKLDGILDELLSTDCMEGDGAVKLLQERLHIRPVNVNNFCLPELGSVRKTDVRLPLEHLPRPRKSSSYAHNVTKKSKDKGSVETHNDSPTPPKSPFSSFSMLSRHVSQRDRPSDPFLFSESDRSPVGDSTRANGIENGAPSPHVDSTFKSAEVNRSALSFSGKFESMIKENPTDSNMVLDKLVTEDSVHALDQVEHNSSRINDNVNLTVNGCDRDLEDEVDGMQQPEPVGKEKSPAGSTIVLDKLRTEDSSHSLDPLDGSSSKHTNHMDYSLNGCDGHLEDEVSTDTYFDTNSISVDGMQQQETVGSIVAEDGCEGLTMKNVHGPESQLDVSGDTIDADNEGHVHSDNAVGIPEQNIESGGGQTHQQPPGESLNVRIKQKAPKRSGRESKIVSRRSLAGAGTKWQGGVRRTTRNIMRPLEYWRGERVVYGRVHESLPSVIAYKYASPAKGKLKVHSFVSDDYKDLVEKQSLY